jgi:Tetratricopeptide repeat
MEGRKRVLGQEHPDTLSAMAQWHLGQGKGAEELQVQVMKPRKKVLGEEHSDTLSAIRHLAATDKSLGQLKDTEELEVQVMEVSRLDFWGYSPCQQIQDNHALRIPNALHERIT